MLLKTRLVNRNFLKNSLVIGKDFFITGRFFYNYGEIQSTNFEYEEASEVMPKASAFETELTEVYSVAPFWSLFTS